MLSDFLIKYRLKNGLSQEELAKKLSVSQNTISQYESGKRSPHVKSLARIANTLGVNVDDILMERS